MSRLLFKESVSLTLILVDPVCETLFQIIYVDPGLPLWDVVFAL
jgi:hypothetical protein